MTSGSPGPSAAASRPLGERAERSFFCRTCKRAHRGLWVPQGWYVIERAAGGGGRHLRLGLYCSLPCLEQAAAGHLADGADTRTVNAQADPVRDRARITERAETLLHQGMTIRAAGDALGVPTSTLRHWLREAGVRVGLDGTLTGPAQQQPPVPRPAQQQPPVPRTGRPAPAGPAPAGPGPSAKEPATAVTSPNEAAVPADPKRSADPGDQAALTELNQLVQLGYLTDVTWSFETGGPAHARVFHAAATGRLSGVPGELAGTGSAGTKAAAKAAAARALLEAAAQ